MPCTRVTLPYGTVAIVKLADAPRKRCACGAWSTLLCDFPAPKRQSGTCDKPLCGRCAVHRGDDLDYCRSHTKPPPSRQGTLAL